MNKQYRADLLLAFFLHTAVRSLTPFSILGCICHYMLECMYVILWHWSLCFLVLLPKWINVFYAAFIIIGIGTVFALQNKNYK